MGTANAVNTGLVMVTCINGTHGTGWNNSNQFFEGKGNIAALYCQIVHNTAYVSDDITDEALRYYNGSIPNQIVVPIEDTQTAIVETQTPQVEETVTVPSTPVETPTVDNPNQSNDSSSVVVETSTAPSQPVESSTPSSETQQETLTADSSTVESVTAVETPTSTLPETPVSNPLPTPPPAVEPQPVPAPVVVEPQPEPQPLPEPAAPIAQSPVEIVPPSVPEAPEALPEIVPPSEPEKPEAPPLAEPAPEEKPVAEEPPPVAEPSAPPVVEEKNETPVEPSPEVQPELTLEPLPLPSAEPAPVIQPDIAYTPPLNDGQTVTLDNGVVITEEEAAAIVLLSNPAELISELFSDPGAVLSALGSVGADMSPEVREKSEKIVLSAVIAGNIATQAAATAGAVAAYRRKP